MIVELLGLTRPHPARVDIAPCCDDPSMVAMEVYGEDGHDVDGDNILIYCESCNAELLRAQTYPSRENDWCFCNRGRKEIEIAAMMVCRVCAEDPEMVDSLVSSEEIWND